MSFCTLIYLVLAHLIIIFLGFLIILFAFVGQKSNQACTTKRRKKGVKFQDVGHVIAYYQHNGLAITVLQVQA